jgi:hypothetical protein
MSDFLLGAAPAGDYTNTATYPGQFYLGALAFPFVAVATGTVTSIVLKTDARTSTATDLELGLYSSLPGGDFADARLDYGAYGGTPPSSSDVEVTGLSAAVVEGETYFIAVKAIGGRVYFAYDGAAGPTTYTNGSAGEASLSEDSVWHNGDGVVFDGPPGLFAYGTLGGGGSESISTGLEFHVTGIMGFGDTSAPYYGRLADPQAGEVVIPLNDSRTASVTVSAFDPVVETLAALTQVPYAVHLKAYYNGHLVFWGPIKVRSGDFVAGTVRFDAVDMSLRLIKHFIREGDVTLEGTVDATTGEGSLPISHTGMRLLRDAGETTSLPPLGIDDGTNDFAPSTVGVMGVRRGDQVWNTWLQMSQTLGPDFELEPRDDGDGYYAQLNTFTRQGTDKSGAVQFHHGTGRQNLEALSFVEGEEYTNLAHVLDKDLKYRETRTNASALVRTGPYIAWDATDFDTSHTSEADSRAVLDAHGDDILAAYSVPLIALNLTLFADTDDGYHYLDDYAVGDTIGVAGKAGFLELPEAPYRVTRVTLSQDGDNVRQGLEVVADRTSGDTIDGTDA